MCPKFSYILCLLFLVLLSAAIERIEKEVDLTDRVFLDCKNSSRNPEETISWCKDDKTLPNATINQSTLRISYVQRSDLGVYQCFIKNKNGSENELVNEVALKVRFFPPELSEASPSVKTFEIGSKGELMCVASGNPMPEIFWFFRSEIIGKNEKYDIKDEEKAKGGITSYLIINNLQTKDGGPYRCDAVSNISVASHTTELKLTANNHTDKRSS